jgi:hypothetical protein
MIKVRIKEEFKNKKIYVGGIHYDLSAMTDEQLFIIWNSNELFKTFLEEVLIVPTPVEEVLLNEEEFKSISKKIKKK